MLHPEINKLKAINTASLFNIVLAFFIGIFLLFNGYEAILSNIHFNLKVFAHDGFIRIYFFKWSWWYQSISLALP